MSVRDSSSLFPTNFHIHTNFIQTISKCILFPSYTLFNTPSMASPSAIPRFLPFYPPHQPNSRFFAPNYFNFLKNPNKNPPKTSPLAFKNAQILHSRHDVHKSWSSITEIDSHSKFWQVGHPKNQSTRKFSVKSSYSDSSTTSTGIQSVCN